MKILFYINVVGGGGAERVMVNLAGYFAECDNDVVFVASYPTDGEYPLNPKIKRLNLETAEIQQSRLKKNISRITKLRNICKAELPDIVISFMAEPNFRAICATRGLPVKTLVSVRNDPNKEYAGKLGAFIGKVLLPMADGCVFQTEDAMKWFPKRLQKKSRIIYNAVKEEFYRIQREPVPQRIVTCGRLQPQKNHKMLIDAFRQIAPQYPNASLHIYGEGVLQDELRQYIAAQELDGRVVLEGQTSDVAAVLKHADIFVLSSDYEGMPNALMEALAAGVPSISTDCPCGGPRMLIEHEKNGLLVPTADANALAKAMDKLLSNPPYAGKTGAFARESAKEFLPAKVHNCWIDCIEAVISGKIKA